IEFAQEILEGIEHGEDYLEGHPTEVTPNYNLRLDLEIGGLISGSVSDECRGYVFARQSTGEFRGSVIWRDLVGIMKRGDGLGKATILEKVLGERQSPSEGVRPYAERMRTLFIKSASMGAAFADEDQVLYLLRGLQGHLETPRATIRGFQSQGQPYSFNQALSFLVASEAAAAHDQPSRRLPLLSRPVAHLVSGGTEPRRFQLYRNPPNKTSPGYFNGECRHCHKWGHKFDDCMQ
ncbi:unnamed protein product, partial [Tilletia controversa]